MFCLDLYSFCSTDFVYFWITLLNVLIIEQVFEDYENETFTIDGLSEVIFLGQHSVLLLILLFFGYTHYDILSTIVYSLSKGATSCEI